MLDQEPLLQQPFPAGPSGSRMVQRPQQGLCFYTLVAPILKALLYSLPLLSCLLDSPPATIPTTPSTLPFLLPLSFYQLIVSLFHFNLQLKPAVLKLHCPLGSPGQP